MKIWIREIEILMFLGVYEYEKLKKTKVVIDLEIHTKNENLNHSNDLSGLVNYDDIINKINSKFQNSSYELIEDLIVSIKNEIQNSLIKSLLVRVCKFGTHGNVFNVCVEKEFNDFH
jgi:FolB domain-containing protein